MGKIRRCLNEFQNEVLEYTGLSIPRFAHLRNRVRCYDCDHWFKASKFLGKEIAEEDKDYDGWGVDIHPAIVCGKCGRKYWTRSDMQTDVLTGERIVPNYRKISKRRLKIRNLRKMKEE